MIIYITKLYTAVCSTAMLFQSDDAMVKKAADLFGKTEKLIEQDVQIVQEWLKTQPHLPEMMEEAKIRNFLILNKYSIEKTKKKIDIYYTIRSVIPEIFENSNPRSTLMQDFMEKMYCCVHPKPKDELYRVHFFKSKSPNNFCVREIGLQCNNISEIRLYEDCMVGDVLILDMSTMTLSDLTKANPVLLSKLQSIYNVFSMRIKEAYIINSPSFVVHLMAIFKNVVKPKIFSRIQVSSNDDILKEIFSKEDLPKDYGGDGPSLEEMNDLLKLKLAQYGDRFDLMDNLKVNESIRPNPLRNDEILGFHGNFKQLNVD